MKIGEIKDTSKSNVVTMNVVLKAVLLLVHQKSNSISNILFELLFFLLS